MLFNEKLHSLRERSGEECVTTADAVFGITGITHIDLDMGIPENRLSTVLQTSSDRFQCFPINGKRFVLNETVIQALVLIPIPKNSNKTQDFGEKCIGKRIKVRIGVKIC